MGEYLIIGSWGGRIFTLVEPAVPIDWSQVSTQQDNPIEVPCPEPDGGWWADVTNPGTLRSADYNAAIDVVNTRPELLTIDIVLKIRVPALRR